MNLVEAVKAAGVVGAGGAGFPTHAKLTGRAEYILMNGAECEPLLRVDQQLMEQFPTEILRGFLAAGREIGAEKAIIGIKEKHKKVIQVLEDGIKELGIGDYVRIGILEDVYPAGDEQVLVYELTGRVVPEGGIPLHVGCVVINSETAMNIAAALDGKSVTEKYLTLAGDIPNRMTIKVPVGTPLMEVLKLTGVANLSEYAVIDGGPMMGPVLADLNGFITKKSKGFVLLKKNHNLIRRKSMTPEQSRRINRATCEQCRMCTDLCPRYLLGHDMQPYKMMRAVSYGLGEDMEAQGMAYLCCQCNLCELFACPIGFFPRAANMHVRGVLIENKIRYKSMKETFQARSVRSVRKLPSKRLVARLGLYEFDKPAPLSEETVHPEIVYIPLSQHVGAPAKPLVKVGDSVRAGERIGEIPENALGAAIHSSIDGVIKEVTATQIAVRRV